MSAPHRVAPSLTRSARWHVPALLLLGVCLAHAEVFPTGKPQQLFPGETFPVPPNWQIPTLSTGKAFHLTAYYGSFSATIQTREGPKVFSEALPWAKDCIVRVGCDQLQKPEVLKALLEGCTNPILLFGYGHFMEPDHYPGRTAAEVDAYFDQVVKAKQAFGKRFLALDYGEWTWGGLGSTTKWLEQDLELFHIPRPTNHDEGAAWWNMTWDRIFKRYQDAGIPLYSFNCSTLNHYEARKGTAITGNEIAYGNPAHDGTFIAFCRGAARQFGLPWGMYAAEYGGPGGHSSWRGHYRPDVRLLRSGAVQGPYTGFPIQQERRTLYTCYMAGANFVIKESDPSGGMLAGYDPLTVERTDPRIVALQDKAKQFAGPYALLCHELHEGIVTKHDRGTPYTPIALLFDKHHGLAFKYSFTHAIGNIPYTPADEQMRAVLNTVFPYEARPYAAGPFGEIFDVITTEAPAAVIDTYRAIVLVGQARVSPELAETLKRFVTNGGLLFTVCEQMTPELWRLAGIRDTGEMGRDAGYLRASDFYVYGTDAYDYHKVKLAGAAPLFVANNFDDRDWPVATINRVGEGCVIVATPVWLKVTGDPTRMHSLFSEIMGMIADELVPVRLRGSEVKVMYNRNAAGWVVTLMNVQGITSAAPGYKPAIRRQSAAGVTLAPRFPCAAVTEWLTGKPLAGADEVALVVPPGDIRIVEFRIK